MSRIGKKPVPIPEKVKVEFSEGTVTVKGPRGNLTQQVPKGIAVLVKDGMILVQVEDPVQGLSAQRGLVRALVANMVTGVTQGFQKTLELVGTGYRVESKGPGILEIDVGFSHKVPFPLPEGITAQVADKNVKVTILGADRQLVGQVAANIRRLRPPEPYKGKGIRYTGEVIRMKAGKTGKASG